MLLLAALVCALAIALALAFLVFGMSGQDIGLISLYLLLSGSLSLALGSGAAFLAFRTSLGIRHKVALAGMGPTSIHRRRWVFMDHLPWTALHRPLPPELQDPLPGF